MTCMSLLVLLMVVAVIDSQGFGGHRPGGRPYGGRPHYGGGRPPFGGGRPHFPGRGRRSVHEDLIDNERTYIRQAPYDSYSDQQDRRPVDMPYMIPMPLPMPFFPGRHQYHGYNPLFNHYRRDSYEPIYGPKPRIVYVMKYEPHDTRTDVITPEQQLTTSQLEPPSTSNYASSPTSPLDVSRTMESESLAPVRVQLPVGYAVGSGPGSVGVIAGHSKDGTFTAYYS